MNDINWKGPNARSAGVYLLGQAFKHDPMMQLFDIGAQWRLAGYIVDEMTDKDLNIYQAYNYVTYKLLPASPYGAFGVEFARKVGGLVQMSLYPESWEREYVSPQ